MWPPRVKPVDRYTRGDHSDRGDHGDDGDAILRLAREACAVGVHGPNAVSDETIGDGWGEEGGYAVIAAHAFLAIRRLAVGNPFTYPSTLNIRKRFWGKNYPTRENKTVISKFPVRHTNKIHLYIY